MIQMRCAALTGINPAIIDALRTGRPRTLELQSAHNIITLAGEEPGSFIFLTAIDMEDLSPGDVGILAQILSISVSMRRIVVEYSHSSSIEERERTSARVQLKYACPSIIKSIQSKGMGNPTVIEVVKSECYHAG